MENLNSKVEITIANPELEKINTDPQEYIRFYGNHHERRDMPETITKQGVIQNIDYETFTCVVRCDDGTFAKVSMSDVRNLE